MVHYSACVNPADWASVASLATAAGTLVLAVATFASVRSANRTARAAEQSLQAGLRRCWWRPGCTMTRRR